MASAIENLNAVPEKDVFALHFLQSLSKIRRKKPYCPNYETTSKRVRKIKTAAYTAMARAAGGTSRPWTRALLRKVRCRWPKDDKKGRFLKRWRRVTNRGRRQKPAAKATAKLRKLVPGGGGMETWRLMEETAHYIKCLSMQVKVMQSIVDRLSA